jgi:hypothetical protein
MTAAPHDPRPTNAKAAEIGAALAKPPTGRVLRAGLAYFGWVFGAGFLLGMVRVPLLVPRLGTRWAELLEMPVMALVIWFAARRIVRVHALPAAAAPRLAAGALALALLLAAELGLGMWLSGGSVAEVVAARDPVSGSVYLAMLLVFALMPAALAWRERLARS